MAPAEATQDSVIRAEILSGWQTEDGHWMAGLKLQLAPGWKTYWRAPGDAGIPPSFDWTGSENLESARISWPRPQVFYQNGMRTIGYSREVVLPIELVPGDKENPVSLKAEVALGVCHDICMPVDLLVQTALPGALQQAAPIRAALEQRPVPGDKAGVGAVTCHTDPIEDGLRLTAHIAMPELGPREVAVIETGDPTIWVSEAKVTRQGDQLTAVSDLVPSGAGTFALDGSAVRITILSDGGKAIDIRGCPKG
ncbi:MAG: protein-disulfide reductase DsbD domain-containing protein [Paracoccaceae bacterium]